MSAQPAQKIIVDTDPGVDDVLAILLALASPEVDVRLISIVFGNTHAASAHANLLKIYHALAQEIQERPEAAERYRMRAQDGFKKTVLALGEDGPIGGEKAVAAYFVCPPSCPPLSLASWLSQTPYLPIPLPSPPRGLYFQWSTLITVSYLLHSDPPSSHGDPLHLSPCVSAG